jgi:Rrf2 family iron-sulfur cluster assembly transcriptional regulator
MASTISRRALDPRENRGMRLSTKGRYAVMAMVDLAQRNGGDPVPLAEIAERQEIVLSYLDQLFAMLRNSGLVKSVRGPGGGRLLGRNRGAMRIAEVILAVDDGCERRVLATRGRSRCATFAGGDAAAAGSP